MKKFIFTTNLMYGLVYFQLMNIKYSGNFIFLNRFIFRYIFTEIFLFILINITYVRAKIIYHKFLNFICTHIYIHTYMHTYIRAYIHTYVHTYNMHTYLHTCVRVCSLFLFLYELY